MSAAYCVLRWTVDLGPVDRRTFDLQESVEELLKALEIFPADLKKNKSKSPRETSASEQTPRNFLSAASFNVVSSNMGHPKNTECRNTGKG